MLEIKKCQKSDIPSLQQFLNDHWKRDHIFVHNLDLLSWQHEDRDGTYNFLLAKDSENDEIVGVLGYIPLDHYDSCLTRSSKDAWGAIWKVKSGENVPSGLGLLMLKKLLKEYDTYGAIGLSSDAVKLYRILGYEVNRVNQYYILNSRMKRFSIASVQSQPVELMKPCNCTMVKVLSDFPENVILSGYYYPLKSVSYLVNRYLKHPVYKYRFLGCYHVAGLKAIIVTRKISVEESCCERIVDILGNIAELEGLGWSLQKYIEKQDSEFIDCINWGIEKSIFLNQGFSILDADNDKIIIPNYYEPFERRNIAMMCGCKADRKDYVFFKGDSDQDRPNILQ